MRDDVPVISYFRFMAVEMQFVGAEESVLVLSYGVGFLRDSMYYCVVCHVGRYVQCIYLLKDV